MGGVLGFFSSVVCEIGPARRVPPSDLPFEPTLSGPVEVEVDGDRKGKSKVVFTYRVRPDSKPKPNFLALYFQILVKLDQPMLTNSHLSEV